MTGKHSSDPELWASIKEDDEKAFNLFFERHWQKVYTSVYMVTRDKTACSQIVNDIFLNLWIKRKELSITFFKSYLTTSATYHVYRYLKMQNSRTKSLRYLEDTPFLEGLSSSADDELAYNELKGYVENSLGPLPKRCREIFLLSRKENLSNDEIAKRLSISKRTVENQLTYALRHIRIAIKEILILIAILRSVF